MIRVLQVFGGLDCGGAETMLMNIYRYINTEEVQFDFVKHTDKECFYDKEILERGGRIFSCPKYRGINHFSYKKWWKKFFKEHPEYKIVHSHVRSTASIILKIAQQNDLKTISHSHSTSNGKGISAIVKNILQKNIAQYSDYCFACSKQSGEWLFGKSIVNTQKFKVIPNAIDISRYAFNEEKRKELRKYFCSENDFVLGHVGRFSREKNHSFLIDLFYSLQLKKPNSKLILIGDGPLKAEIEQKVNELNLSKKVLFLGVRADVADLLNMFDSFVFPSIYEGLPVTLVEAQANGLPIVASDVVTDEVVFGETVKKLSLNESCEYWAQQIILTDLKCRGKCVCIDKDYDINNSSKWLQEFYTVL